ncbi:hypothetical protein ABFP60_04965 [Clostridioides difficile]
MSTTHIITGNLGSGKTEFAINFAIKESLSDKKVALIDIDIVNPYFCSRDYKEILTSTYNIEVISPKSKLSNAELMILTPDAVSCLNSNFDSIIIDVGGDTEGIKALIQLKKLINPNYKMYYILNTARPQTKNNSDAFIQIKSFEQTCGLNVTDIISNTHYGKDTNCEDILYGDRESFLLANKLNVSYTYILCFNKFKYYIKNTVNSTIFELNRKLLFPWD